MFVLWPLTLSIYNSFHYKISQLSNVKEQKDVLFHLSNHAVNFEAQLTYYLFIINVNISLLFVMMTHWNCSFFCTVLFSNTSKIRSLASESNTEVSSDPFAFSFCIYVGLCHYPMHTCWLTDVLDCNRVYISNHISNTLCMIIWPLNSSNVWLLYILFSWDSFLPWGNFMLPTCCPF